MAPGRLELWRPDKQHKMSVCATVDLQCVVRSMRAFRLTGTHVDYIVVGSDTGGVAVLEVCPLSASGAPVVLRGGQREEQRDATGSGFGFRRVHLELFGHTGCRRTVAGEYVATDPRGRALMVAAVEKQRLAYVLNRDQGKRLTISSPLDASRSHTLLFDLVGCDMGFDNPVFAALELSYEDVDADHTGAAAEETPKMLTFYELDLGLNNVVRKLTEEADRSAVGLAAVPGAADGPGGVLVMAENWILYHSPPGAAHRVELRTALPRRADLPHDRSVLPVCHALNLTRIRDPVTGLVRALFFFIVQSDLGDLYKVTLQTEAVTGEAALAGSSRVSGLTVQFLDTIAPCSHIIVTAAGLLIGMTDTGSSLVYALRSLGDDEGEAAVVAEALVGDAAEASVKTFTQRPLRNLAKVSDRPSLAALTAILPDPAPSAGCSSVYADFRGYMGRVLALAADHIDQSAHASGGESQLMTASAAVRHLARLMASVGGAGQDAGLLGDALRLGLHAADGAGSAARLLALCGRGPRSRLLCLSHGRDGSELGEYEVHANPKGLFTVLDRESVARAEGRVLGGEQEGKAGDDGDDDDQDEAVDRRHSMVVVSFVNGTMVLGVADDEVKEMQHSGLITTRATLACGRMSDGSIVQVHPGGIRQVAYLGAEPRPDDDAATAREAAARHRIVEWKPPEGREIVRAALNRRQVLIALDGPDGDLTYFEMPTGGAGVAGTAAASLEEKAKSEAGGPVLGMSVGDIPPGRVRCPYAAVLTKTGGEAGVEIARLVSCQPGQQLGRGGSLVLRGQPESVALRWHAGAGPVGSARSTLMLYCGLDSGVLQRARVDPAGGTVSDTRTRFLGARSVRLAPIHDQGQVALLAMSSSPWLAAMDAASRVKLLPVALPTIDLAAPFSAPEIPDSIVAAVGSKIKILSLEEPENAADQAVEGGLAGAGASADFHTATSGLRYTPRRVVPVPILEPAPDSAAAGAAGGTPRLVPGVGAAVLECELDGYSWPERVQLRQILKHSEPGAKPAAGGGSDMEDEDDDEEEEEEVDEDGDGLYPARVGNPLPQQAGRWCSAVRLVSADGRRTLSVHDISTPDSNEAALSICAVGFSSREAAAAQAAAQAAGSSSGLGSAGTGAAQYAAIGAALQPAVFVLVGTGRDLQYHPRRHAGGRLHCFRLENGNELRLEHTTELAEPPLAMCACNGRVIVSQGGGLRTYDIGKRRMLLKCETSTVSPTTIVRLTPLIDRHERLRRGHGAGVFGDDEAYLPGQTAASGGDAPLLDPLSPWVRADRLAVGDARESVIFAKIRSDGRGFVPFADDAVPRATACLCCVDRSTVAVGDKHGTITVLRAKSTLSDDRPLPFAAAAVAAAGTDGGRDAGSEMEAGRRALWAAGQLNATLQGQTLTAICSYYAGSSVTDMHMARLSGGSESIVYSTISGFIGAMLPVTRREEMEALTHLQMYLRTHAPSLVGRWHLHYRGYFSPLQHVIDGDLCESFAALPMQVRQQVAEELDRSVPEVARILESVRSKVM